MGKSQTKQAQNMANESYRRTVNQTEDLRGGLMSDLDTQKGVAQDTYNQAKGAYSNYGGPTGAYDPTAYSEISNRNKQNVETGGYNPAALTNLRSDIGRNVQTGGYTNSELSQLEMGGLGGVNAEQADRIRGGYNDFIKSGGLSDQAADAMRRQAAGTTQSIYSTLGSKLARSQSIAGMGGAGGETAQMARQAAESGATATTGANAEIGKLRQQGTIQGLGGLAGFEENVGAGNREALRSIQQGRLQGTEQEAGTEASVARGTLQASAAEQDLASGAATQRMQAAGGLVNLYNSSPGYVTSLVKSIIDVQNSGGQLNNEQAKIMSELAKTPGLFDNIMKGIQTVGGAAAGVMTGVGGMTGAGRGK